MKLDVMSLKRYGSIPSIQIQCINVERYNETLFKKKIMAYNVPVCYMYHSHFSQENNKQNKVIERKKSLCCSVIGVIAITLIF